MRVMQRALELALAACGGKNGSGSSTPEDGLQREIERQNMNDLANEDPAW
jgi:hypothetical protein